MVDFNAGPVVDQIFEITTTEGFSDIALGGPKGTFGQFQTQYADGEDVFYKEQATLSGIFYFEIGLATYNAGTNTLTRQQVLRSSNSDNPVDWPEGTKDVFAAAPGGLVSALLQTHIGPSRPAWLPPGGLWVDSSVTPNILRLYDGNADTTPTTNLSQVPADVVGATSSNVTFDLSTDSVLEVEPTGDLQIDATGLASGDNNAVAYMMIKNGGFHTITFTSKFLFEGGTAPALSTPPTVRTISGGATEQHIIELSDLGNNGAFSVRWNNTSTRFWVHNRTATIYEYDVVNTGTVGGGVILNATLDLSSDLNDNGNIAAFHMKNDGSRFWIVEDRGSPPYNYFEYDTTTVGTVADGVSISASSSLNVGFPLALYWSDDGSKFWIANSADDQIEEFILNTSFTLSNGRTFQGSRSVTDTLPFDISWKPDGTRFWILGSEFGPRIYEYTPSVTGTVVSGITLQATYNFNVSSFPRGLFWSNDGSKFWVTDDDKEINEFTPDKTENDVVDVIQLTQRGSGTLVSTVLEKKVYL